MKVAKIKGTLDYFGYEMMKYRHIEKVAKSVCERCGYQEMMTPIFEATEVFSRSAGEGSDIVNKEMYTFMDRGERSITLRPEGTAGVTRAFVENKIYAKPGLSQWYYFGPMFRYERPQAGRLRQFTQFGVEAFGVEAARLDADVINLNYTILQSIGINKMKVVINSLGSHDSRENYIANLKEHFAPHLDELCNDCKIRFQKNPLRMLDCKVDQDKEVMKTAPAIHSYLSDSDRDYFNQVIATLDLLGIPYLVETRLVRGLDYYSQTVFEIIYDDSDSPLNGLALSAGGRYNSLTKEFDGPPLPAIGFAMGIERLMMVMDELNIQVKEEAKTKVTILTVGEAMKNEGLKLANYLRNGGLVVAIDYQNYNLKPQFKLAERMEANYLLILGEEEYNNRMIKVKDASSGVEQTIAIETINEFFGIKGEPYAYQL